jgi:anti-anti-sigma factor
MDKFAIAVLQLDEARLLRLSGEFDIGGVGRFERHVGSDGDPKAQTTIIDLGELQFMDSSGLRALLQAESALRAEGRRVVVVRSSGQVAELLELTGVSERLEMADEIPTDLRVDAG